MRLPLIHDDDSKTHCHLTRNLKNCDFSPYPPIYILLSGHSLMRLGVVIRFYMHRGEEGCCVGRRCRGKSSVSIKSPENNKTIIIKWLFLMLSRFRQDTGENLPLITWGWLELLQILNQYIYMWIYNDPQSSNKNTSICICHCVGAFHSAILIQFLTHLTSD